MTGDAAVAQHRDLVADLHDLVELVRDEDESAVVGGELTKRDEEVIDLGRREHRGRLIEDEELGVAVQGLEDLGALSLADRELPDVGVGVDVQSVALRHFGQALAHRSHVGHAASPTESEGDVLGDRQGGDQHEVLVDHADAEIDGIGRRSDGDRLAPQMNGALVGRVEPVEDLHQRGLAGTVFAQEGVDGARQHREIDRVVGHDAREALGDTAHLQHGCLLHRSRA